MITLMSFEEWCNDQDSEKEFHYGGLPQNPSDGTATSYKKKFKDCDLGERRLFYYLYVSHLTYPTENTQP